jgi:hypothetical protein
MKLATFLEEAQELVRTIISKTSDAYGQYYESMANSFGILLDPKEWLKAIVKDPLTFPKVMADKVVISWLKATNSFASTLSMLPTKIAADFLSKQIPAIPGYSTRVVPLDKAIVAIGEFIAVEGVGLIVEGPPWLVTWLLAVKARLSLLTKLKALLAGHFPLKSASMMFNAIVLAIRSTLKIVGTLWTVLLLSVLLEKIQKGDFLRLALGQGTPRRRMLVTDLAGDFVVPITRRIPGGVKP